MGERSAVQKKGSKKPPPPPLKVYTTDPAGFRELVQKLTGKETAVPQRTHHNNNARLQKVAPERLNSQVYNNNGSNTLCISPGITALSPINKFTASEWASWSESLASNATANSPTEDVYRQWASNLLFTEEDNKSPSFNILSSPLHKKYSNNEDVVVGEDLFALPLSPTFCEYSSYPQHNYYEQQRTSPRCSSVLSPTSLFLASSPRTFELGSF